MKIAYLGYDILIECLKMIRKQGHEIIKIFTVPSGDRYDLNDQILVFGADFSIPVVTERISSEDMDQLLSEGCELLICAGYPYRIPVLTQIRAINIHPELLPRGRGSWPMPVTILRHFEQSGVTIHKLSEEFDAGDILSQVSYDIEERETLVTLTDKIQKTAVRMLQDCLGDFERIYQHAVPQASGKAEYWADPSGQERIVTLQMSAEETDRRLRAFAGYGCLLQTETGAVPIDLVQYREIRISDMEEINRIRELYHNTFSAYTFPCIYCWKQLQNLSIYIEEDWFSVKCDGDEYYYPCGNPDKTEVFLKTMEYTQKSFRLGYIQKDEAAGLADRHPELDCTEDRDNFDYIVPMKQFAELEGKHYRTIRKEIHQFERSGVLETEEINEENVHIVEQIAIEWSREAAGNSDYADTIAEESAVRHYARLNMTGILAKKDGVYFGFVMGTPIDGHTVDVHFAKCIDTSPGADFYCKQMFCRQFMDRYEFMNMEEDMGNEGIRTRKLLFRPTSLTEVCIAEYHKQDGVQHG
ncbi:MAG: phosphatidylglycerol lysyltransferase domain-containing protein [bacterium]|nr:phosphatidylglycerol lysyltransferase domain-containing protein [bacterium]